MTWVASTFLAFLTGALAMFCANMVASACASWYRISTFEGAAGYFVVCIAIYGGIAGCIIGFATARFGGVESVFGFIKTLGIAWGIVLGISGTATSLCWLLADIPPKIAGRRLELQVELRLPISVTNSPAAAAGESYLNLGSVVRHVQRKSERGKLSPAEARLENGRWIVPGEVFLFTMRGHRSVDFVIGGQSCGGFLIPLPRRPGRSYEQWSNWFPDPRPGQPRWPDTQPSCRFRVKGIVPPPPPPDPAVVAAERFAALLPEAPLSDYLMFLRPGAPEDRFSAVITMAEQRPTELAQLIRSPESNFREPALTAVTRLTKVAEEISEAVLAEGHEIASGIRSFNAMKTGDPKFYDVQVQLRTRFSYWHHAWWTIHQLTNVDGRPPVQEILDVALVRSKDTSMDEIVINARAHLDGIKPMLVNTP